MNSKLHSALCGFLLGTYAAVPAIADDIEIYRAGSSTAPGAEKPNLMLLIDTSLSMLDSSTGTDWDPHFATYDDSYAYLGDCETNKIYWTQMDEADVQYRKVLLCNRASDQSFVYDTEFVCDAGITSFDTTGKYLDKRILEWRVGVSGEFKSTEERWRVVHRDWSGTPNVTRDCQDDRGIHGPDSSSSRTYMRNGGNHVGDQRWYTSSSLEPSLVSGAARRNFFTGNYVNWLQNYSLKMRITAVKEALLDLLDGPNALHDVNIGIARFDHHNNGGMIIKETVDLATNKQILIDIVKEIRIRANDSNPSSYGSTPLSESLYEVAAYFHGLDVDFGDNSYIPGISMPGDENPADILTRSVAASRTGGTLSSPTYKSPIVGECQANHVIVLTDGLPTQDYSADNQANANLPGFSSGCGGPDCLDDIAGWLYDTDHSSTLNNDQRVITHTVGFDIAGGFLDDTAAAGHGTSRTVNNTADLVDAITEIIEPVIRTNASFTAPAVSVNTFNRAFHKDELYFTVFSPDEGPHWDGNLKKFKLAQIVDAAGTRVAIVDAADIEATVDGFFKDTARSVWTPATLPDNPDGGKADRGGAVSKLTATRNLFTDADEDNTNLFLFAPGTPEIGKTDIGLGAGATASDREYLIKWIMGLDGFDEDGDTDRDEFRRTASNFEVARIMGDPLHSRPTVVTYGSNDSTVFFATNDGFLHAIDAEDGTEQFAFIPRSVWGNFKKLKDNVVDDPTKMYGIDGELLSWVIDRDKDGSIEPADGDKVYLFIGMRRGGNNYYALDVTDRAAPQLLWRILGGTDNSGATLTGYATGDFTELGETWSGLTRAKIDIGGTLTDILVFGGGYDAAKQDDESTVNLDADTVGRGVFMVDATSGNLLYRIGPDAGANLQLAAMKNSIPSQVRVIDLDGNGIHDRMYVGDMGGRIWRFDIINGQTVSNLVEGGLLATLGAANAGDSTNNRRFYYPPDVSIYNEGGEYFLNIAIGSGYRAHPNNKDITDRFYMLRDTHVEAADTVSTSDYDLDFSSGGYSTNGIEESELADLSNIVDTSIANTALIGKHGWYLTMEGLGEKVLADSITISKQTTFTTFTPTQSASACEPGIGTAKIYSISSRLAQPHADVNSDTLIDKDDRSQELALRGIPPRLVVLFPESAQGEPVGFVGTEEAPIDLDMPPRKTYWYSDED